MGNFKFNLITWFSLIIIALVVASIDVMMFKVNEINPQKEPIVTKIVYNDLWYKISVLMFLVPAIFSYHVNKKLRKSIFVIIAGLLLIFFGLEDVFYFSLRSLFIPNKAYSFKVGSFSFMPEEMLWLNNNLFISFFGRPVTPYILFESTAFALVASLILVML